MFVRNDISVNDYVCQEGSLSGRIFSARRMFVRQDISVKDDFS
jgi:hypothetical protein